MIIIMMMMQGCAWWRGFGPLSLQCCTALRCTALHCAALRPAPHPQPARVPACVAAPFFLLQGTLVDPAVSARKCVRRLLLPVALGTDPAAYASGSHVDYYDLP